MNKYLKQLIFPITTWWKNGYTALEVNVVFSILSIFHVWPCFLGYCEEQGAVGGAGLEEDINDLRLEEENEQPPLILETDWLGGEPDPSVRGRLWCCYSKCDTVGGVGWVQF